MGFLREILGRPDHEHAMFLMPVGYPAEDAKFRALRKGFKIFRIFWGFSPSERKGQPPFGPRMFYLFGRKGWRL
ncbi:MAG: hypothetical protein CM1200mP21_02980 [Candidatus Poseidoniales archaeon]|nr:MAG: hypothetical protein CM1200mP21_02980 [Candidatus Poseidoniales archaeon]